MKALTPRSTGIANILFPRSPWNEFDGMHREMEDALNRLVGYAPLFRANASGTDKTADLFVAPDFYETESHLVFVAPLPGYKVEDLSIEATTDSLNVFGSRSVYQTLENPAHLNGTGWSNRTGEFQLRYSLGREIDPKNIQASLKNGVLELRLPKVQPEKPETVKIALTGE